MQLGAGSCVEEKKENSVKTQAHLDQLSSFVDELIQARPDQRVSLEDFSLIRVIGRGSFAKVTLVRKKDNSKIFAMKVLSKPQVVQRQQVEHTKTERRVLGVASHPFIVSLHYAFQTKDKLYFVLDYCPGGELFFHLTRMGKFSEEMTRFYLAELVVALEHLHSLGVIYRDLKPENVLLDELGHLKLADFGLSKDNVTESTSGSNSLCGTPEYLAPEVLNRLGHGTAVDWWGLGMVAYEMLTGLPPWYTRNREELFTRIREAELEFPAYISTESKSLIRSLLHREPQHRLGSQGGATQVKGHAFFRDVDWNCLLWADPPFKPSDQLAKETGDTSNFEQEFLDLPLDGLTPPDAADVSLHHHHHHRDSHRHEHSGQALVGQENHKIITGAIASSVNSNSSFGGGPQGMFSGFTYEAPSAAIGSNTSEPNSNFTTSAFL